MLLAEVEDEEEDMRKKEQDLLEELNIATLRCEDLKRTLIETKSFIDPKLFGLGGGNLITKNAVNNAVGKYMLLQSLIQFLVIMILYIFSYFE